CMSVGFPAIATALVRSGARPLSRRIRAVSFCAATCGLRMPPSPRNRPVMPWPMLPPDEAGAGTLGGAAGRLRASPTVGVAFAGSASSAAFGGKLGASEPYGTSSIDRGSDGRAGAGAAGGALSGCAGASAPNVGVFAPPANPAPFWNGTGGADQSCGEFGFSGFTKPSSGVPASGSGSDGNPEDCGSISMPFGSVPGRPPPTFAPGATGGVSNPASGVPPNGSGEGFAKIEFAKRVSRRPIDQPHPRPLVMSETPGMLPIALPRPDAEPPPPNSDASMPSGDIFCEEFPTELELPVPE